MKVSVFWHRRDLRLDDNTGLSAALESGYPVLPIFIFDTDILKELKKDDARLSFIHQELNRINRELGEFNSSILCLYGTPLAVLKKLEEQFEIANVFTNRDYEPYAIKRDEIIKAWFNSKGIEFSSFKDQLIFEPGEVLKNDGSPYTVYTPFKNKWRDLFKNNQLKNHGIEASANFFQCDYKIPELADIGFVASTITVKDYSLDQLEDYKATRDIPSLDSTSKLSVHLRFGTVSIRQVVSDVLENESFLNELIWREFFMQILYHFPHVVTENFRPKYNGIQWRNKEDEFERWKNGNTGYPMVDAGMRELNATGYMHNRVRMVVAGFLCKHLLIDWRWGEAYFAEKLLDYELASNNGNWQWAAGTGCDAAPYFRVFNPTEQVKKFDPELKYIRKWVPEIDSLDYPPPMVEHKMARERAISIYREGIERSTGNTN